MLKHVRIKEGKSVYLGRETLMVRSSDQEFFSVPEPNEEKGRLGEEQEALLTAEEYDQWGENTFKLLGEVDEDIHFVPMPQASLTESERTSIAADGQLHKCWHDFQDAIGETS